MNSRKKILEKLYFYLDLELKHHADGILGHQLAYTQKMLSLFNEDKAKPVTLQWYPEVLTLERTLQMMTKMC